MQQIRVAKHQVLASRTQAQVRASGWVWERAHSTSARADPPLQSRGSPPRCRTPATADSTTRDTAGSTGGHGGHTHTHHYQRVLERTSFCVNWYTQASPPLSVIARAARRVAQVKNQSVIIAAAWCCTNGSVQSAGEHHMAWLSSYSRFYARLHTLRTYPGVVLELRQWVVLQRQSSRQLARRRVGGVVREEMRQGCADTTSNTGHRLWSLQQIRHRLSTVPALTHPSAWQLASAGTACLAPPAPAPARRWCPRSGSCQRLQAHPPTCCPVRSTLVNVRWLLPGMAPSKRRLLTLND